MRLKKTYEEIEAIALKYKTLKDFIKNAKSAYTIAASNDWMSKFTWLKRVNNKWTKENCEKEYQLLINVIKSKIVYYK